MVLLPWTLMSAPEAEVTFWVVSVSGRCSPNQKRADTNRCPGIEHHSHEGLLEFVLCVVKVILKEFLVLL